MMSGTVQEMERRHEIDVQLHRLMQPKSKIVKGYGDYWYTYAPHDELKDISNLTVVPGYTRDLDSLLAHIRVHLQHVVKKVSIDMNGMTGDYTAVVTLPDSNLFVTHHSNPAEALTLCLIDALNAGDDS